MAGWIELRGGLWLLVGLARGGGRAGLKAGCRGRRGAQEREMISYFAK